MEPLTGWINTELDRRGWSRSEAARRGGVSDSMFSKVISGYANPGLDFCRGLARAFSVPLEDVFRLAEILPPKPAPKINETGVVYRIDTRADERQLLETWRLLNPEDRGRVLDLINRLAGKVEAHIIGATESNE